MTKQIKVGRIKKTIKAFIPSLIAAIVVNYLLGTDSVLLITILLLIGVNVLGSLKTVALGTFTGISVMIGGIFIFVATLLILPVEWANKKIEQNSKKRKNHE